MSELSWLAYQYRSCRVTKNVMNFVEVNALKKSLRSAQFLIKLKNLLVEDVAARDAMSKDFLYKINGEKRGRFWKWLENFKGTPKIAWYPSAGEDLRDIEFLVGSPSEAHGCGAIAKIRPDIFLHTDYYPWDTPNFLESGFSFVRGATIEYIEELPRCDLPLDYGIVSFPAGSDDTGRVIFVELSFESVSLGRYTVPLIYAFVENEAFCARKILPGEAEISHVIHVRYGGGLGGGGSASGCWLLNVLRRLKCQYFISDGNHSRQDGDERAYELYPELAGPEIVGPSKKIRVVCSEKWSGHGDVVWEALDYSE